MIPEDNPPRAMEPLIQRRLAFFSTFVIAYFLIVWIRMVWLARHGVSWPQSSFLPDAVTFGGDFFGTLDYWIQRKFEGVGFGNSYFPGASIVSVVGRLVFDLNRSMYFIGSLFAGACLMAFVFLVRRFFPQGVSARHIMLYAFSLAFCSYPMLFELHTLNYEFVVFLGLIAAVHLEGQRKERAAMLLISLVASMKVWPLFFVASLPRSRTFIWRAIVAATATAAIMIACFYLFGGKLRSEPGTYLRYLSQSLKMYEDLMVYGAPGLHYSHSLTNFLQIMNIRFLGGAFVDLSSHKALFLGSLLAVNAAGFLLLSLREYDRIDRVVACCCFVCLFVPTSVDYKLLVFFIPLTLILAQDGALSRKHMLYVALLLVIIVPKPFFYFGITNLSSIANPVSMIVATIVALGSGFPRLATLRPDGGYGLQTNIEPMANAQGPRIQAIEGMTT
jgi:hypothetical protein